MKALFSPAVALMSRLGYSRKFAVMGALALAAIAVLLFGLHESLDRVIRSSQHELAGIEVLKPMARLVQQLQQHRGLSSSVLNGDETVKEQLAAKAAEVREAFKSVEAKFQPSLVDNDAWKKIRASWTEIDTDGLDLTGTENFAAHTRLIRSVLVFQAVVSDEYSLTNDPDIDSRYLADTSLIKLPVALESLGQLRSLGTGVLTKKQLPPLLQTNISSLLRDFNVSVDALRINLGKTARYNPGIKPALDQAAKELTDVSEQIANIVQTEMFLGAFVMSSADYFATVTVAIDKGYKQMFETLLPSLEQLIQRRINTAQHNLRISISVAVLMLMVFVYVSVGAYYATIQSINRLAANARTMATGDLSIHVDLGTRDELKRVGDSLNDMTTAFRSLIQNVQSGAGQVHDATTRLSASSAKIRLSTEQQSEAASAMAAAVEQMTVGVDHISKNAQDASSLSQRAGELSVTGGNVVGTVVHEIQMISQAVNQSATIIDDLGQQSEKISAIVNVIKEIADQTNLLALNAAIEAARAGESGRGFAVVADEVRKLAERTSKSTHEISQMIVAIQNGTNNAVTSMNGGVQRVSSGVTLALQAGTSIGEIEGSSRQVMQTVSEISSSLREQSVASTEIARNVERIAQMAEENSAAVAENAATASQLERLSESLKAEAHRFKLG
ncbi:MAG: methyl-accepting chemotaxis protein [Propionivibrio sp.]|uniref:methyl-accepting chemotaxis protein n=1 Tax=Propionivibrio sp. TaxID=2212460 RepID=UPI0025EC8024|nr:methyl-accepting chemotaxis protein [Propionivibrio sp.]MBL0208463.1 methyl-accepting chemotaxis protein [Propionivibrio sp.]